MKLSSHLLRLATVTTLLALLFLIGLVARFVAHAELGAGARVPLSQAAFVALPLVHALLADR